jgi:hypothetical protein
LPNASNDVRAIAQQIAELEDLPLVASPAILADVASRVAVAIGPAS